MKNLTPIQITDKIKLLSGVNVFEQTRTNDVVEMRSLVCYLLRDKRSMRWTAIAEFFVKNNKSMNHATVIHAVKNYPLYCKHNKKLIQYEKLFTFSNTLTVDEVNKIKYLESKCNKCEQQLIELSSDDSLYNHIKDIPDNRKEYIKNKINIWIEEYEWKSKLKDSSTVYAGI